MESQNQKCINCIFEITEEKREQSLLQKKIQERDAKLEDAIKIFSSNTKSTARCAQQVRQIIDHMNMGDIGYQPVERTPSAKYYGKNLEKVGFQLIGSDVEQFETNQSFQNGDVIVFGAVPGVTEENPLSHGHIQIYYKGRWYSDYQQSSVYASQKLKQSEKRIYRQKISK